MRIRRALSALTDPIGMTFGLLVLVPGLLLLLAPRLGLGRAPVFAVVLALRQPLTVGLGGVAMVVILLSLIRAARPYLLPAAVALTLIALVSGITLVSRGLSGGPSPESAAGQAADPVVEHQRRPGGARGDRRAGRSRARGHPGHPGRERRPCRRRTEEGIHRRRLPDDAVRTRGVVGGVGGLRPARPGRRLPRPRTRALPRQDPRVAPTTPDVPLLVALHAPQPGVRSTGPWSSTLAWVEQQCTTRTAVAVGDFNGTVDNFGGPGLGGCHDAAVATGSGAVSTWPTSMPAWLGMPIDHVLAADGWTTTGFSVITDQDGGGARHRPILAVLRKSR